MSQTTSQISFQPATIIRNRLILLVGAPGFEPGTSCAQGKRATRLRHAPTRPSVRCEVPGVRSKPEPDTYCNP